MIRTSRMLAVALAAALASITALPGASAPRLTQDEPAKGQDSGVVRWQAGLMPRELFFGPPDVDQVRISPDGRLLGFLAPHEGVLNVWVQPTGHDQPRRVTDVTDRPIRSWHWAHNSQQVIYALDINGDENFHLFATDVDLIFDIGVEGEVSQILAGGPTRDLTPFKDVQARYLCGSPIHPDEILALVNRRDPSAHDVWRINTRTGDGTLVLKNRRHYISFLADDTLEVRVASRVTPSGGLEAHARSGRATTWFVLARWGPDEAANSRPLTLARDERTIYLADSRRRDTSALYEFQAGESGAVSDIYQMIASDERADLAEVVCQPGTGRPLAVAFDHARRGWVVLDPTAVRDFQVLSLFQVGDFRIVSQDHSNRLWIVSYDDPSAPVSYWLYNRNSRSGEFLFSSRRALEDARGVLAPMRIVQIPARGGVTLTGYLTTPIPAAFPQWPGSETGQRSFGMEGGPPDPGAETMTMLPGRPPFPMVLLVHDGPWSRDGWGFNPLHQWLANRGYAVLSVNFRGSTGFGKQFTAAGNRQWTAGMHDDLIDATIWAVDQGIAHPDRIAIMGSGYGGYAALVGLSFTPEFFTCGIDFAGPSSVNSYLRSIPEYWKPRRAIFEARIGPLSNAAYLDSISPLRRADDIVRPLLIAHGGNDPRVRPAESEQLVEVLQSRSAPVTYVVFPDEAHELARAENRLAFLALVEQFLAAYLGGRAQPVRDAVGRSTGEIRTGGEFLGMGDR